MYNFTIFLNEYLLFIVLCYYNDMKKIDKSLEQFNISYDINKLGNPSSFLFIDIETTGLSSAYSFIYMIGLAYIKSNTWHITQLFAQNASEEADILMELVDFSKDYSTLIHFNGNTFDIPFIKARMNANNIDFDIDSFRGIDLYRRISPYKSFLRLSSLKQKSIEQFLGINREDLYDGGQLIKIYKEYSKSHDSELFNLLYCHNYEDMLGMLSILPVLSYGELFDKSHRIKKVEINKYKDVNDIPRKELFISIELSVKLPVPISENAGECYFTAKDDSALIKIPIYHEELKYFYENYKDYYYLPIEDTAIHKSVAVYVDKDFRTQATAATCYTRKEADFLPQWDYIFSPFFKRDYKSKNLFFELTDENKKDRDFFSKYVSHILEMMIKSK